MEKTRRRGARALIACACYCLAACARQPEPSVKEAITGPFAFAYREVVGDYSRHAAVSAELRAGLKARGIETRRSIGIYLDDPQKVPADRLRSVCGVVIEEGDWGRIDGLKGEFRIQHLCKARSLIAERRAEGSALSKGGSGGYYAALSEYAARKGYGPLNSFELYEPGKTSYVLSTSDPRGVYPPRRGAAPVEPGEGTTWPDPDWRLSTPESEGMSSRILLKSLDRLRGFLGPDVLDSLLITRHGKIVAELAVAPDEPSLRHEAHSVTKSVLGALVGIAVRRGYISGVGDRVLDYFPGEDFLDSDDRKESMRIGDLLDMTSGLSFPHAPQADGLTAEASLRRSGDWARFALGRPMDARPGERFNYSAGDPNILSAVITKATGMNARAFAERELFGPLGISNIAWLESPGGNTAGDDGLYMRPRDLAKFGYLFLRDGLWKGERILPKGWASGILSGSTKTGVGAPYYSRYWWIDPSRSFYSACGAGGQFVMVLPREDIVAVVTAKDTQTFNDYFAYVSFIELANELILPAVKSDGPLPEDAEAREALASRIAAYAVEAKAAPPAMPEAAKRVSGRLWRLERNALGLRSARLEMGRDAAVLELGVDTATLSFPIGLDGAYRKSGRIDYSLSGMGGIYASRGRWEGEDSFAMEYRVLEGDFGGELRLDFDGDQVRMKLVFSDPFTWSTTIAGR
jgi:CubicO group peptidase (beta-lactamase class C family)